MFRKTILISGFFVCILVLFSCKDKKIEIQPFELKGGKGGDYNVAIFTKEGKLGKASRIFLKYAAEIAPADTNAYEERANTMTEPGFGPHAHFNALKTGTYYILALGSTAGKADTALQIQEDSVKNLDIILQLK